MSLKRPRVQNTATRQVDNMSVLLNPNGDRSYNIWSQIYDLDDVR